MIKNKLVKFPDQLLWQPSKEVTNFETDELYNLANNLRTLNRIEKGLGIAAPQAGYLKRVFYFQTPDGNSGVFCNPKIINFSSAETAIQEGCLSIRGYYWEVVRPAIVDISWQDLDGNEHEARFDGLMSRLVQHEIDHLDGKLIVDYLDEEDYSKFEDEYFNQGLRGTYGPMLFT